jgi:parvulin-like peptidyl-prolyl isomerase
MPIRVNGEMLNEQEIADDQRAMLPQLTAAMPRETSEALRARAKEWARENTIERALLRQAALADPEPVGEGDVKTAMERMGSGYQPAACLQQGAATPAVTEAELLFRIDRLTARLTAKLQPPKSSEISGYYRKDPNRFFAPEMVHAAHIVCNVDERTDEAAARAKIEEVAGNLEGGAEFSAVADEFSDCPGRGGDLGFFQRGVMVPEFDWVVFDLPAGEISKPFRTLFGYHIARVMEHRPAQVRPFEEVRDEIAKTLYAEKCQRAVNRYLDQLRAKAVVEIT